MSRLTKKYDDNSGYEILENNTTCNTMYDVPWTDVENCVDKLGRLEDLEEELGCSLEVLIKGLINSHKLDDNCKFMQTIITYNPDDELIEGYEMEIDNGEYITISVDGRDNYNDYDIESITLKIKDYQKTWWLKGEKDE